MRDGLQLSGLQLGHEHSLAIERHKLDFVAAAPVEQHQ